MKNFANIINFVRACEPRVEDDSYLFETTKAELELCEKYGFKSTVLLQYDAMIDGRYIELLNKHKNLVEIGLWFEVVQPLCEDCGIKWRGRFPWDWHSDVGFLVGYLPEERTKIIDKAFEKFKEIFGYFPTVAGSWHIDAFSLNYMKEKYGITASCNCKEQCLTDGYTIWGGVYNGAYYPSKKNMLSPAQTKENQINLPVFRMLGADPVHQYDLGLGTPEKAQKVVSLEPVYGNSGADENWVKWYLKENFNPKNIGFSYTQLGQENSFGWDGISDGLSMQFKLLNEKINSGEIELMTLGEAGKFFSENYDMTPCQSIFIDKDYSDADYKTLWFYSRFYRANVLFQNGRFWLRDLYLFNENFTEKYFTEREETHDSEFYTLSVMDGYRFSRDGIRAGIYLCKDGEKVSFSGEYKSKKISENSAEISVGNEVKILLGEEEISVEINNDFIMRFEHADCEISYGHLEEKTLKMNYRNFDYSLNLSAGFFGRDEHGIFIKPERGKIVFKIK